MSATYIDGSADGGYSVIRDGKILEKGIYKNGKREGEWIIDKDTFVYENGIPLFIYGDWVITDRQSYIFLMTRTMRYSQMFEKGYSTCFETISIATFL